MPVSKTSSSKDVIARIDQADVDQLTTLDLRGLDLEELPSSLSRLTNLTSLVLSDNRLNELPSEIGQLANLTELFVGDNRLTDLPPEIGLLVNLNVLQLSSNNINDQAMRVVLEDICSENSTFAACDFGFPLDRGSDFMDSVDFSV